MWEQPYVKVLKFCLIWEGYWYIVSIFDEKVKYFTTDYFLGNAQDFKDSKSGVRRILQTTRLGPLSIPPFGLAEDSTTIWYFIDWNLCLLKLF